MTTAKPRLGLVPRILIGVVLGALAGALLPDAARQLGILGELFPGRAVVGIHAVDLVLGLGTLHCLTQQQPRP